MRVETELRRSEFLGGIPVFLADGQEWAFPGPRELVSDGEVSEPAVGRLLEAVLDSQDEFEQARMELALAIHLLTLNYRLAPDDYDHLFDGRGLTGKAAELRCAFHDLSRRFLVALAPKPADAEAVPAGHGRRFRLPRFLPSRRAAQVAAQRAAS